MSGMMHEPSLEGESHCQSWSVVAENCEYQRSDVQQESDCEDSDSFTTSAVFLCPSCGCEVDVRHHLCPTCHKVLTLFEHGADSEQQPRSPSVFPTTPSSMVHSQDPVSTSRALSMSRRSNTVLLFLGSDFRIAVHVATYLSNRCWCLLNLKPSWFWIVILLSVVDIIYTFWDSLLRVPPRVQCCGLDYGRLELSWVPQPKVEDICCRKRWFQSPGRA